MELEPGFEPQLRARSNTWPLPRPEASDEAATEAANAAAANAAAAAANNNVGGAFGQPPKMFAPPPSGVDALGHVLGAAKKNSSRRNAWGNMSYADLITQAIQSAPENRLTLSQIYDWMVQNVPYFKDKGDSNSSAGWKVRVVFFVSSSPRTLQGGGARAEAGGDLLAHRGDLNARHPRPHARVALFNARFLRFSCAADFFFLGLEGRSATG